MAEETILGNILNNLEGNLRGPRLIDWILHESPGRIVDEQRALRSPCLCYAIPPSDRHPKEKLCFSKGSIGPLTDKQEKKYCKEGIVTTADPDLTERVQKFRGASDICVEECKKYPKGDRLSCRLDCMGRELDKRGIGI